ncbi:hypothetical protein [Dactylosporangium salmoneum]|uniref:hypothetical protein n=1 Tax=Dactylosporangium salmoneum TaxID=53361 RepID=UPI0031E0E94C
MQRVGTKRPARVLVRFLDAELEGREEWVPPGRLQVRWDQVDGWLFDQQRWDAVCAAGTAALDTVELGAADWVLEMLLPKDCLDVMDTSRHGVLRVTDPAAFAAAIGIDPVELAVAPGYIMDSGTVIVPWPGLLTAAQKLAERHADRLLDDLHRKDEQAELEAVRGRFYPGRDGGQYISAAACADANATVFKPRNDMIRQWCGAAPRECFDELVALRAEVLRLGDLVAEAVTELRRAGKVRQANDLERRLGVPVEQLTRARRRAQG